MRRVIPAYTWGPNLKARLEREKLQRGDIVVLNSNSGPDDVPSSFTVDAIAQIRAAGAWPMGYIPLGYGHRQVGEVLRMIRDWRDAGIYDAFYDEAPYYYDKIDMRRLTAFLFQPFKPNAIRAVFNKGTSAGADAPYANNLVVTHEGPVSPAAGQRAPWEAALCYGGAKIGPEWTWGYSTPDTPPNPWDGIPTTTKDTP